MQAILDFNSDPPYGAGMISLSILLFACLLISFRQFLPNCIGIWHLMLGAALLLILSGKIALASLVDVIDWEVILLLSGMFIIGSALKHSGGLTKMFRTQIDSGFGRSMSLLVFMVLAGLLSALLTNDTIAIVGVPLAVLLAHHYRYHPSFSLLALAFSVTLGSAASPLGNPQNFIIANSGQVDLGDFLQYLALPAFLSLLAGFFLVRLLITKSKAPDVHTPLEDQKYDPRLFRLAVFALALVVLVLLFRPLYPLLFPNGHLPLWVAAVAGAVPVLVLSPRRRDIVLDFDWQTIVFFIALFIATGAVWQEGQLQAWLAESSFAPEKLPVLGSISMLVSQIISNVPLTMLYVPILEQVNADKLSYLALAAFSTLAGNVSIMGAASNVIVIQQAERSAGKQAVFGAGLLMLLGIPLTLISLGLYVGWWRLLALFGA